MSKPQKYLLLLFTLFLSTNFLNAQSDKFGFKFSLGESVQKWNYKNISFPNQIADEIKGPQKAFDMYGTFEKTNKSNISYVFELGYQQRGFNDVFTDIGFFLGAKQNTTKVETHNINLNSSIKSKTQLTKNICAYLYLGLGLSRLIAVKDWELSYSKTYHSFIFDEYKTIITSSELGFGFTFGDKMYFDLKWSLPISSNTKGDIYVYDYFSGISIGVYIHELQKNKSSI